MRWARLAFLLLVRGISEGGDTCWRIGCTEGVLRRFQFRASSWSVDLRMRGGLRIVCSRFLMTSDNSGEQVTIPSALVLTGCCRAAWIAKPAILPNASGTALPICLYF